MYVPHNLFCCQIDEILFHEENLAHLIYHIGDVRSYKSQILKSPNDASQADRISKDLSSAIESLVLITTEEERGIQSCMLKQWSKHIFVLGKTAF